MNKMCTENIVRVIELSRLLVQCADEGDNDREDDSCGVLFGISRDTAYRIMELAVAEKKRHISRGTWDEAVERECCSMFENTAKRIRHQEGNGLKLFSR